MVKPSKEFEKKLDNVSFAYDGMEIVLQPPQAGTLYLRHGVPPGPPFFNLDKPPDQEQKTDQNRRYYTGGAQ